MNKELKSLLELDFDQFGRIYEAKIEIEKIRSGNKKLKILDVGGYKGNTLKLFPKDDVLVIDQLDIVEENYLKASALDIPFEDNYFDAVVSFDVFEHIKQKDRLTYIKELIRVSNNLTIIAAPFMTKYSQKAELLTNSFYKRLTNKDHPWLVEHIDNSLPKEEQVIKYLESNNIKYKVINNNNVYTWNLMQHYILLSALHATLAGIKETNKFYNNNIDDIEDYAQESYRKIFIIGEFKQSNTAKPKKIDTSKQLDLVHKIFSDIGDTIEKKNKAIDARDKDIETLRLDIENIHSSISWRITGPLRKLKKILRKGD